MFVCFTFVSSVVNLIYLKQLVLLYISCLRPKQNKNLLESLFFLLIYSIAPIPYFT